MRSWLFGLLRSVKVAETGGWAGSSSEVPEEHHFFKHRGAKNWPEPVNGSEGDWQHRHKEGRVENVAKSQGWTSLEQLYTPTVFPQDWGSDMLLILWMQHRMD